LEQSFINGSNLERYNKFAGNIKCKNIDPEIRKYIGFESQYFESLPQPVQDMFLNKAIKKYIRELEENKENVYGNIPTYDSIYDSAKFGSIYDSATSSGLLGNYRMYESSEDSSGNTYHDAADAYVDWYKRTY
jgi:hypothetical protein